MLSQKTSPTQQTTENDVCDACGTIVELGSVIAEGDTVLVLPFTGADKTSVKALTEKYITAAKTRFPDVITDIEYQEVDGTVQGKLTLQFDCTAEKLIFEMGLSAI